MPVSIHHPRYEALQSTLMELRKTALLSQVQLAEKLGVGQSYASKIERDESCDDFRPLMPRLRRQQCRPDSE